MLIPSEIPNCFIDFDLLIPLNAESGHNYIKIALDWKLTLHSNIA